MIPVAAAGHICRSHHWQIPKKQNKKFLQAKYEDLRSLQFAGVEQEMCNLFDDVNCNSHQT
jgi:hypothetical protein